MVLYQGYIFTLRFKVSKEFLFYFVQVPGDLYPRTSYTPDLVIKISLGLLLCENCLIRTGVVLLLGWGLLLVEWRWRWSLTVALRLCLSLAEPLGRVWLGLVMDLDMVTLHLLCWRCGGDGEVCRRSGETHCVSNVDSCYLKEFFFNMYYFKTLLYNESLNCHGS